VIIQYVKEPFYSYTMAMIDLYAQACRPDGAGIYNRQIQSGHGLSTTSIGIFNYSKDHSRLKKVLKQAGEVHNIKSLADFDCGFKL